jgi:hypothetical protein
VKLCRAPPATLTVLHICTAKKQYRFQQQQQRQVSHAACFEVVLLPLLLLLQRATITVHDGKILVKTEIVKAIITADKVILIKGRWAVPGQYQGSTRAVPGQYQGSTRAVPGQYQGSTRAVPGQYQGSTRAVPGSPARQPSTAAPVGASSSSSTTTTTQQEQTCF